MQRWTVKLAIAAVVLTAVPLAQALPKANQPWIHVRTQHFDLFSNAGERRTQQIGKNVERLREVLSKTSKGLKMNSPLPTKIYVFRGEKTFAEYNLRVGGRPSNVSGYFVKSDEGNYVAMDADAGVEPFRVIYHEYLHYFLANNFPNLPLWLNEGLAEFYSTFSWRGSRAELGHPIDEHLYWLARHPLIPLSQLFEITPRSSDYNEGRRQGTFYAQSWALTHYLLTQDRAAFGDLVQLLDEGVDSATAFREAYDTDLNALVKVLAEYVGRKSFSYYKFKFDEGLDEHQARVQPLGRAQLLYELGDLLAHLPPIRFRDAEEHLLEAIQLNPKHAAAHTALGRLREAEGRGDEAVAYFEKAIGLDPDDGAAYAAYGWNVLERFSTLPPRAWESTPPELLKARRLFQRSIKLQPDRIRHSVGFAKTFLFDKENLEPAIDAMTLAVETMPSHHELLLDLLTLFVNDGDEESARILVDDVFRHRADQAMYEQAQDRLLQLELERVEALLEQHKGEEARAILQRVAGAAHDPKLKRFVIAQIASLSGTIADNAMIERYNRAIEMANTGDVSEAVALLEQIIDQAADPALKIAAQSNLDGIRRAQQHNRIVDLYNEAIRHANAGQTGESIRLLEQALALEPGTSLRAQVEKTLHELRLR